MSTDITEYESDARVKRPEEWDTFAIERERADVARRENAGKAFAEAREFMRTYWAHYHSTQKGARHE